MSRWTSIEKMGYYPFGEQMRGYDYREIMKMITRMFPNVPEGSKVVDPFAGEGNMLKRFESIGFEPYGSELDAKRAETLMQTIGESRAFASGYEDMSATKSGFQVAWLNPPYEWGSNIPSNRREIWYAKQVMESEWVQPGGINFIVIYRKYLNLEALIQFFRFNDLLNIFTVPGLHFGKYEQVVIVGRQLEKRRGLRDANEIAYTTNQEIDSYITPLIEFEGTYELPTPVKLRRFWFRPNKVTPDMLVKMLNTEGVQNTDEFSNALTTHFFISDPQPIINPNQGQYASILKAGIMDGVPILIDDEYWYIKTTFKKIRHEISSDEEESKNQDGSKEKTTEKVFVERSKSVIKLLSKNGEVKTLGQEISIYDFITENIESLMEFLQKKYKPLFDIQDDSDPLWQYIDKLFTETQFKLGGTSQLYYSQRKVVSAIIRKLETDGGLIFSGQMGVGKSVMSLATAYALFDMGVITDTDYVLVLSPGIMKKNWYYEAESILSEHGMNLCQANAIYQVKNFLNEVRAGTGKLNILIIDEYRAKTVEGRKLMAKKAFSKVYGYAYINPLAETREDYLIYESRKNGRKHNLSLAEDQFWWVDPTGEIISAEGLGEHPIPRGSKKKKLIHYTKALEDAIQETTQDIQGYERAIDKAKLIIDKCFDNESTIDHAHALKKALERLKNSIEYARWKTDWNDYSWRLFDVIELLDQINELGISTTDAVDEIKYVDGLIKTANKYKDSSKPKSKAILTKIREWRINNAIPRPIYQNIRTTSSIEKQRKFDYRELLQERSGKRLLPLPSVTHKYLKQDEYIIGEAHVERTNSTMDGNEKYTRANSAISLTDYIVKKSDKRMKMLIADEAHLYKNTSGRGVAFLQLAAAARYVIAATGTGFNGKVSSLFYLLRAVAPRLMKQFPFNAQGLELWIDSMGSREIKESEVDKYDDRGHKTNSSVSTIRNEAPGASDQLMKIYMSVSLTFLLDELFTGRDLDENGEPLKIAEYNEAVSVTPKDPVIWQHILPTLQTVTEHMAMMVDKYNDQSFFGKWYRVLWDLAKSPYQSQKIYHRRDVKLEKFKELEDVYMDQLKFQIVEQYKKRGIDRIKIEKLIAVYEGIDVISKEERQLALNVQRGIQQGRHQCVFVRQTGRDMQERIKKVIEELIPEAKCLIMSRTNPKEAADRQEYITNNIGNSKPYNVLITNTQLVEVGLNLLSLVDMHHYELQSQYSTMAQSSRRSLRANQRQDVNVMFYISKTPTAYIKDGNGDMREVMAGPPLFEELLSNGLSKAMKAAKYMSGESLTAFAEMTEDEIDGGLMKEARAAAMRTLSSNRWDKTLIVGSKVENSDKPQQLQMIELADDPSNIIILEQPVESSNGSSNGKTSHVIEIPKPVTIYDGLPLSSEIDPDAPLRIHGVYLVPTTVGHRWLLVSDRNDAEDNSPFVFANSFTGHDALSWKSDWVNLEEAKEHGMKRIDKYAKKWFGYTKGIRSDELEDRLVSFVEELLNEHGGIDADLSVDEFIRLVEHTKSAEEITTTIMEESVIQPEPVVEEQEEVQESTSDLYRWF